MLIEKLIHFYKQGLEKGGNGDCVINAGGNIADAKLKRRKERVWAHVPIDLLAIINATCFDEKPDIALKRAVRLEMVGDTGTRHSREHFRAGRLQSRVYAKPERGRSREPKPMREHVTPRVHNVDSAIRI